MKRTRFLRAICICGWIALTAGCTRPETAWLRVPLPEASTPAEVEAVRDHLQEEQSVLPDDTPFYREIRILTTPVPEVEIEYYPDQIRIQNILYTLNQLGYSVGDRVGDPERRRRFLKTLPPF